jgi:hypothetical protein|tara:strand:- start:2193 stop:2384 length:192 start_codon:yes stop_codon:yes gene_type:complete
MKKLQEFLQGKKTYIIAGVGAIIYFLRAAGIADIPPETEENIFRILAFLGLGTVSAKMNRNNG